MGGDHNKCDINRHFSLRLMRLFSTLWWATLHYSIQRAPTTRFHQSQMRHMDGRLYDASKINRKGVYAQKETCTNLNGRLAPRRVSPKVR